MAGDWDSDSNSDSDFDGRLRGALRSEATGAGFEDAASPARVAVVAGVRRRHHQRVAAVGGVAAVVVALAVFLSVGLSPSPSGGGSHVPEATRGAVHSPARATSGDALGSGGAGGFRSAPTGQAPAAQSPDGGVVDNGPVIDNCPFVAVGSSAAACGGTFTTPAGDHSALSVFAPGTTSASGSSNQSYSAALPFAPNASTAGESVHLGVGELLTVALPPADPFARWVRPTVTSGRSVLVVTRHSGSGRGVWRVTFRATRAGTATVTAQAVCRSSAATSSAYQSVCHGGTAHWHVTVEVTK